MHNVKYSKWIDKQNKTIVDVKKMISQSTSYHDSHIERDEYDGSPLLFKVYFAFDRDKTIAIKGVQYKYNFVNFSYETLNVPKKDSEDRNQRVKINNLKVVVVETNRGIFYLVNKPDTPSTLTSLRKLHNLSENNKIVVSNISGVKSDLFIWLVHNLIDEPEKKIGSDSDILVSSLTAFRGEKPTEDESEKLNKINGSGETIMKMVTTLLFLLESKSVSSVELQVNPQKSNLDIKLTKGGGVELDLNRFIHPPVGRKDEWEQSSEKLIFIFFHLIPEIIDSFSDEQSNKKWTPSKIKQFYRAIGKDIKKRITEIEKQ
ncbi:hypothetical protein EFN46_05810 [Leuconostoc pseudomesenteroides]|uniref:hypothetical protein n=1 Tax=Leuconostoc pseudomesenteroides TaxID=33968 RepID=UPI0021AA95AB|nr:hypothetical protein [Leuconostoc pseudomesenteroides]MCT4387732.1 hypothetical protein [Leuconostoc pseudomesenteroides]